MLQYRSHSSTSPHPGCLFGATPSSSPLQPPDTRSTMGLGPVIPTISNTIGAVVVGWGLSCLYVLVSRVHAFSPHLACAIASSACLASKPGHTINDIQMIVLHTKFWCVDPALFHPVVLTDHRIYAGPLVMVRVPGPRGVARRSSSIRILEALHQAFVGHIAWYYIVE